ncbi:Gfo/Idh/MocA family oxidoreductase [Saccharibacillus sp. CPCC 101409]|uniref:Gfo/Idh/MocA family protein n=1 Tax=Saccharibacillus sp. CPCC 101409 TaxID=3058041 RepID=UPI002673EA73|nr:Gfo/Idh/MocA family oxidoreductase [Saccharibacillus sp. CPCC 101409]MDO3409072.1 Gfo/Idh/MocA family oxidoreductase [Saccharibacillus sp. CPCC 101409]
MGIRIGKASLWHVHAWDYIRQAQSHPDADITAVWDEVPERGRKAAEELGVPFYETLDDMLASGDVDAVIVDAPTNRHKEVLIAAARAGKHIFTEKVIAPTESEVSEIIEEVRQSGIKLTVSLPRLNDGYTLAIRDILDKGLLGRVTYVRTRLSHNGALADWLPQHFYNAEQCGGGALIDLGCHPMYLAALFLGEPVTGVSANFGYITGKEVEDNAVASLYTDSGAIASVEAGFVNSHSPFAVEVHGTDGTLLYGTPESKLLLRSNLTQEAAEWTEQPLPDNRESAFDQWVRHIRENTTADENIATAVELTRLMEAANRSARDKSVVSPRQLNG